MKAMKPFPLLSTSKMAHLIQCVTHHLCRGHGLTRFRHRPRPTCHTAAGFPAHVFHPLAGRAPSTTCFIRDGVTTEWTCGLWLWGFRRRSCRPFQALVMVKSIHRTGGDFCVCAPRQTASTFGPKSKSRLARLGVISNTTRAEFRRLGGLASQGRAESGDKIK
jgi:hypothetical protein